MTDPSLSLRQGKREGSPSSTTHDAHDITSLSDLPARRIKTKLWPMSPIHSLSAEEVMAIAGRDQTPVLIAVLDGDDTGEQYLCSNKKGATVPPEVAAEGSWAQKCYQQVAVLNDTVKEMRLEFQPVWQIVKAQQIMLIAVELSDGLQEVANKGLRRFYNTWSREDSESIITTQCDFRSTRQVHYFRVLKNYTRGRFSSLNPQRLQWVEDLLQAGEKYLENHAQSYGFHCPPNVREMFKEFLHIKKDRNKYSHPLTLAKEKDAYDSLQILKKSVNSEQFPYFKSTKNLLLLGADYAESILQAYGKLKDDHFLDPKGRGKSSPSPDGSGSSEDSLERPDSPAHSPLNLYSPQAEHLLYDEDFHVGESSQHPSSPQELLSHQPVRSSPPSASKYPLDPNQPRSSPPSASKYPPDPNQPRSSPPPASTYPLDPNQPRSSPLASPPANPSPGSPPVATQSYGQQPLSQPPPKGSSQSPPSSPKALSAASQPFVPTTYRQQPANSLKRSSVGSAGPSQSPQSTHQSPANSPSPASSSSSKGSQGSQSPQHSATFKKQKK